MNHERIPRLLDAPAVRCQIDPPVGIHPVGVIVSGDPGRLLSRADKGPVGFQLIGNDAGKA